MFDRESLRAFVPPPLLRASRPIRHLLGRGIRKIRNRDVEYWMQHAAGVVHVGSNTGQEAEIYDRHGLQVLWIDCLDEVFQQLLVNIAPYSRQRALRALLLDKDDSEVIFHVSSNNGASSSIFKFQDHRTIWPDVSIVKREIFRTKTLDSLCAEYDFNLNHYHALVLDVQGAELLVLKGAEKSLKHFKFIQSEVPDFQMYKGGVQLEELDCFLQNKGYQKTKLNPFAVNVAGGRCYDVVWERAEII